MAIVCILQNGISIQYNADGAQYIDIPETYKEDLEKLMRFDPLKINNIRFHQFICSILPSLVFNCKPSFSRCRILSFCIFFQFSLLYMLCITPYIGDFEVFNVSMYVRTTQCFNNPLRGVYAVKQRILGSLAFCVRCLIIF